MYSPEVQSKVEHWRMKAAAGQLTQADVKEFVTAMREGRAAAMTASAASKSGAGRKKAPAKPINVDDLFGEIDKL